MRTSLVIVITAIMTTSGCTWQANSGSQAVEINPLNYGTDRPVIQPSNMPGYIDGQPVDMRRK